MTRSTQTNCLSSSSSSLFQSFNAVAPLGSSVFASAPNTLCVSRAHAHYQTCFSVPITSFSLCVSRVHAHQQTCFNVTKAYSQSRLLVSNRNTTKINGQEGRVPKNKYLPPWNSQNVTGRTFYLWWATTKWHFNHILLRIGAEDTFKIKMFRLRTLVFLFAGGYDELSMGGTYHYKDGTTGETGQ